MNQVEKFYSIAIDGPAGSGKSSVAKMIAKELNWTYISTGNMFRAYAWYLQSLGINQDNEEHINDHLNDLDVVLDNHLVYVIDHKTNQSHEISEAIKHPSVASYASKIATYKNVRNKLLWDQRKIAATNNVVMDGRDIGSVVLPFATLKIYLDASIKARTERRIQELKELDVNATYDYQAIYDSIALRDYNDSHRELAPLVCVPDAIVIHNDHLNLDQTKDLIIQHLHQKI